MWSPEATIKIIMDRLNDESSKQKRSGTHSGAGFLFAVLFLGPILLGSDDCMHSEMGWMEPRISIQLSTIPRTSNWGCRTQCCPVGRLGFAIGRCTPTPRPFCVTLSRREYRSGITQHQLDTRPHSTNYYQAMRWMVFPYITSFLPGASFPALGSPAWSEFPALVSFHSCPKWQFHGEFLWF